MTSQEAQSIIKRLCNHATKEAKMHGIDLDFADGIILSLHEYPYNKFRIGINTNFGSHTYTDFRPLNAVFNANGLEFYNKFNGIFYFFNQDEFAHRINGTNWCVVLDKLIEHAGAYFEFPNPNIKFWTSRRDEIDNMISIDCEKLRAECKHQSKNMFYTPEYQALLSKYRPMLAAVTKNIEIHAAPIKISLVPSCISNVEQLIVWLDVNEI